MTERYELQIITKEGQDFRLPFGTEAMARQAYASTIMFVDKHEVEEVSLHDLQESTTLETWIPAAPAVTKI